MSNPQSATEVEIARRAAMAVFLARDDGQTLTVPPHLVDELKDVQPLSLPPEIALAFEAFQDGTLTREQGKQLYAWGMIASHNHDLQVLVADKQRATEFAWNAIPERWTGEIILAEAPANRLWPASAPPMIELQAIERVHDGIIGTPPEGFVSTHQIAVAASKADLVPLLQVIGEQAAAVPHAPEFRIVEAPRSPREALAALDADPRHSPLREKLADLESSILSLSRVPPSSLGIRPGPPLSNVARFQLAQTILAELSEVTNLRSEDIEVLRDIATMHLAESAWYMREVSSDRGQAAEQGLDRVAKAAREVAEGRAVGRMSQHLDQAAGIEPSNEIKTCDSPEDLDFREEARESLDNDHRRLTHFAALPNLMADEPLRLFRDSDCTLFNANSVYLADLAEGHKDAPKTRQMLDDLTAIRQTAAVHVLASTVAREEATRTGELPAVISAAEQMIAAAGGAGAASAQGTFAGMEQGDELEM